jgi:hypothetical protein
MLIICTPNINIILCFLIDDGRRKDDFKTLSDNRKALAHCNFQYFQKCTENFTFSLFLTECLVVGNMSIRWVNIGLFGVYFCVCWRILNYKNYYKLPI